MVVAPVPFMVVAREPCLPMLSPRARRQHQGRADAGLLDVSAVLELEWPTQQHHQPRGTPGWFAAVSAAGRNGWRCSTFASDAVGRARVRRPGRRLWNWAERIACKPD